MQKKKKKHGKGIRLVFGEPLEALPKGRRRTNHVFVWGHTLPDVGLRSTPAVTPHAVGRRFVWALVFRSRGEGAGARPHNKSTPLFRGFPQWTLILFITRVTVGDQGCLPSDRRYPLTNLLQYF